MRIYAKNCLVPRSYILSGITSFTSIRLSTRVYQNQKSRLVLTDEPAKFAFYLYVIQFAHKGHYAGAKIEIIRSISKKKLKKAIFSSKDLAMSGNMVIFANSFYSL